MSVMSTVSREENMVMSSSEDSWSPSDETDLELELELGLGLSLGGFKVVKEAETVKGRIFTAKDFGSSSSSSSSSSTLSRAGTKRCADSVPTSSQVVGWPPIRAYRMNSMANQAKSIATEEFNSMIEKNKSKTTVVEKGNSCSNNTNANTKVKTSLFVKVNMDGIPIGRKVDLNAHSCYETLAQTLEDMFHRPTTTVNAIRSSIQEDTMAGARRHSKLLDGSSEFVLTYEDKEGDWMLVGDVPWRMFLSSVKRLRIMRMSEATGLAPRLQERNGMRGKPI